MILQLNIARIQEGTYPNSCLARNPISSSCSIPVFSLVIQGKKKKKPTPNSKTPQHQEQGQFRHSKSYPTSLASCNKSNSQTHLNKQSNPKPLLRKCFDA